MDCKTTTTHVQEPVADFALIIVLKSSNNLSRPLQASIAKVLNKHEQPPLPFKTNRVFTNTHANRRSNAPLCTPKTVVPNVLMVAVRIFRQIRVSTDSGESHSGGIRGVPSEASAIQVVAEGQNQAQQERDLLRGVVWPQGWENDRPPCSEAFLVEGVAYFLTKGASRTLLISWTRVGGSLLGPRGVQGKPSPKEH